MRLPKYEMIDGEAHSPEELVERLYMAHSGDTRRDMAERTFLSKRPERRTYELASITTDAVAGSRVMTKDEAAQTNRELEQRGSDLRWRLLIDQNTTYAITALGDEYLEGKSK
jgi:hypothetical protein